MYRLLVLLLSSLIGLSNVLASHAVTDVEALVKELDFDNFTRELSQSKYTESTWLIEYYAHWCPHCQHYKPIFDKIGAFFHQEPRPEPVLWVARVDCAAKGNMLLCDKFLVRGFPTLFLGNVNDFMEYNQEKLISVPPKQPPSLIESINSKLDTHYVFEEKKIQTAIKTSEKNRRDEMENVFDVDDVERATVELFDHLFGSNLILQSPDVRLGFIQWVELLAEAHPSRRCRQSCRYLLKQMGILWPENSDKPSPYMSRLHVCTVEYEKKSWQSCAASVPERRGFTCGLWQLLHALSIGIGETQTDLWMRGVRAFDQYFFGCRECAKHFLLALNKEETRRIQSRRELALWLWATHNRVNKRLNKEEEENGMGDPAFPKIQWPPVHLCPLCPKTDSTGDSTEWKESEVFEFLNRFYAPDEEADQSLGISRKELKNGEKELTTTDVFSEEDATAMELRTRSGSYATWYVLIVMVSIVILLVRRSKRRKLVPSPKDIL